MIKNFFKRLLKVGFYLTYIILIVAVIVLGILSFTKTRELDSVNRLYTDAQGNLNKSDDEKTLTIENLQTSYQELNDEVNRLKSENSELKSVVEKKKAEGYGEINGKVFPFIVGDSSFSQYQYVCAENSQNKSLQHCVTVSAIDQNFKIILPAGKYTVSARILAKDSTNPIATHKAIYSEYVKCVDEKSAAECNTAELSTKPVVIEVKDGSILNEINPVDWTAVK